MKFTYNVLKVSVLAVAMVAVVACGSKKHDDDKKSSDSPSTSGSAIMVSNDGATSANGKVEIASCSIGGVSLPLAHNIAKDEAWTGTINVATSNFVSGSMVCKDASSTEYHAWYHYSKDGMCADADMDSNNDCKKGATMYHHFFSVDSDSGKWGKSMTNDMRIEIWSATDVSTVTCNVKGTDIALTNVRSLTPNNEGWDADLVVPQSTFNYGDKVDVKCSNGKEIHVYAKGVVEDEASWE